MKRPAPIRATGHRLKVPPGSVDHDGKAIRFTLPADEYRRLLVAARARNISVQTLIHRAVKALIEPRSGAGG